MKKTGIIAILLLCVVSAKSQDSKFSYGVKAGLNLSSFYGNSEYRAATGFQIGVFGEYQVAPSFYIQPALEYTTKGAISKPTNRSIYGNSRADYLEMPIMVVYKIDVAPKFKISFNAGPYLGCGVYGKTDMIGSLINSQTNTFGSGGHIRHLDMGLGGGVGAEYENYLVNLNYEYGLMNILPGQSKMGNVNFALTVGYRF